MPTDPRTPLIAGVSQLTNRPKSETRIRAPLALMTEVARGALDDAGVPASAIDSIQVVNIISWTYADPAGELAEEIGAAPREKIYTPVGGNTPQWLVNRASEQIANGELDVALIVGAESFASATAARAMGRKLDRGNRGNKPPMIGDDRAGAGPAELQAGLIAPTQIYPLIENAYRASKGRSIDQHQAALGKLCESFNAVAAENPLSWLPERHTADEIARPGPVNRLIAFPYTKWMNSILKVDQAAALLLMSEEAADKFGVTQRVYPQSGAECNDAWFVTQRPDFAQSPAIRGAAEAALEGAGIEIGEVEYIDLYSCFPCAVELGADAIGLPTDGSRALTLTGGLMYFGGPGNNYVSHSIAEAVKAIRDHPQSYALCTALGWYVTKHAIGVYAGHPPERFVRPDLTQLQDEINSSELPLASLEEGEKVEIVSSTVLYDREGKPTAAPAIVSAQGKRSIAHLPIETADDVWTTDLVGMEAIVTDATGVAKIAVQ